MQFDGLILLLPVRPDRLGAADNPEELPVILPRVAGFFTADLIDLAALMAGAGFRGSSSG
jgi:hypothetical protein